MSRLKPCITIPWFSVTFKEIEMKVKLPLDEKAVSEMSTMREVLDLLGVVNREMGVLRQNEEAEIIDFDTWFKDVKLYHAALDILHHEIDQRSAGVKRSFDRVLMAEKSGVVVQ